MDIPAVKKEMATVKRVKIFKYTGSDLAASDTICNPIATTAKILTKNTRLSGVSVGEV
jgi:hypothetical protein